MIRGIIFGLALTAMLTSCSTQSDLNTEVETEEMKINVYQVFTRLFGNTSTNNIPWGTLEENGVGKFNDFSPEALNAIRELGVSHIWYTGVLHHAMVTDYSQYGIPGDDPDVVKGRAGSPYSIKDYYNVDPDLATQYGLTIGDLRRALANFHAKIPGGALNTGKFDVSVHAIQIPVLLNMPKLNL